MLPIIDLRALTIVQQIMAYYSCIERGRTDKNARLCVFKTSVDARRIINQADVFSLAS